MNEMLRSARLKRGWSQEEAAAAAGVATRTYQRWEHEDFLPNFASRRLLREAFQASSDEELGFHLARHEDQESEQGRQIIRLTSEEITALSHLLGTESNTMVRFDESKRLALRKLFQLAGIAAVTSQMLDPEPWERMAATSSTSALDAGSFDHFYSLMEGCWGLSNSGDMQTAEHVLSGFLPRMIQLAPSHRDAAIIASQGLRLSSLLRAHQLKVEEMVPLCLHSVECAKLADSADALSASLNGLAVAYKYAKQPENSFKAYQEAIYYSDQASPLLRSRVYAGASAAFAQRARAKEADFYIQYAYESFPDHPERDPNYLSADNGIYMLAYYEGIAHLEMKKSKDADRAFESYKQHADVVVPERNRLEIVNHRGRAAIMANDLDVYLSCLEEGISGSLALKSKKRFDEALNIFQQDMPRTWLAEPRMQQVIEHYRLSPARQG